MQKKILGFYGKLAQSETPLLGNGDGITVNKAARSIKK
jgi:hypothetical protein